MKAHLVSSTTVAILLLGTTYAAQPNSANSSRTVVSEFEVKTGKWKPAGPKPVVPNNPLTPAQRKAQRTPWTWERLAMQPVRILVMAVKAPLMVAGYPALAIGCAATNQEIPDPSPMFDNFDPGPAIDADLERMHPRAIPKDESAPTPFKSNLRVTHATPPSIGRTPASMNIAYNRPAKAPATPTKKTDAARAMLVATQPQLSDLELLLICCNRRPSINTELSLTGSITASKGEQAMFPFGSDIRFFSETPASIMRPIATADLAFNH